MAAAAGAVVLSAAGPAAASTPAVVAGADGCGLSRLEQSYTVCGTGERSVEIYFMESITGGTANSTIRCWGPGTYQMFSELGGFRLATVAVEGGPCTE